METGRPVFALAALVAGSVFAQERGPVVFTDSFDTPLTFVENWVVGKGWAGRISSTDGKVLFPQGGDLQMRRDTPPEFCAEMDLTLDMSHEPDKAKWDQAFCGFMIEGYRFMVLPAGKTWMIFKLSGHKRAHGKQVPIEGFALKKPVRLTLLRKVENDAATYRYRVNGKDAGSFVCEAPAARPSADGKPRPLKPLVIFSYRVNMTLDNFSLFSLKRSADDSRNVILNSSFEHEQDGFPIYFGRSGFDFAKATTIPYEDFLATWSLDTADKHSGRQSLKIVFNESTRGQTLWAWGAGTVKDLPGVFSVWLKADREDFPVWLSYGKRQKVKVGTSWQRYEVVNPKLPGAGVYSPVTISLRKAHGTLWVDDLQAEFLGTPDGLADLEEEGPLATPYRPSELDKQKFTTVKETPVRAPGFAVARVPDGLVPSGDLDTWRAKATRLDTFYFKLKEARNKTELYLACDNRNLYLGYRCFVGDLSAVSTKRDPHDSFSVFAKDSVEFLLDPEGDGVFYQFAVDAGGTRTDIGKGGDVAWNPDWEATVELNEKTTSIDYEITVPFATLAGPSMGSRWLVNLCRNDGIAKQQVSLARTPILGFKQTAYCPVAELPEEVVADYSVGAASGAYSDDDEGTTISLVVRNRTGRELQVKAELVDAQKDSGVLAAKGLTLRKGANDITFGSKMKTNRVRLRLARDGAALTDQTVPLEERNPVTMLGRLSYYMTEKEAAFKVNTTLAGVEGMTAVLTVAGQTVRAPAAPELRMAVPLEDIPYGTHPVALALAKGDQAVASASSQLVKRPYRRGAAQVNHFTRSLIHDGKAVFQFAPFFVFVKHQSKEYAIGAVDWIDRYGFRYLHLLVDNRAVNQALWAIGRAQEKGIRVMLWTKYRQLTDEEGNALRKRLDFPNVLAQMVMDEPELGTPSEVARAFLRKMRASYPYHPVHMNNTVLGIPNRYADLETDILMLDDYLTNTEKRTVASVVRGGDVMWRAGEDEGKPCFYFLVCGNFPLHHREPTYAEQIAQTYGNIAAGCTGFSYFYGAPATPGNWKAYTQLNREVLALNDVLLSEEEVTQGTWSVDPKTLRSITRRHGGHVYVIACNIGTSPLDETVLALPAELNYAREAEVMFEDRRVQVRDGKFTDSFPGYSRHVYKLKIR